MDINHLTLEELKIVKDAITQRINELSGETPQQESLEKSKLALRKYILENKEEVIKDLEEMRKKSSKNEQETLEEAAKKYAKIPTTKDIDEEERYYNSNCNLYDAFKEGVKWQSERMYRKEEVLDQLNHLINMPSSTLDTFINNKGKITDKWFEQFRNK
jgi:hypothetical protein